MAATSMTMHVMALAFVLSVAYPARTAPAMPPRSKGVDRYAASSELDFADWKEVQERIN